MQLTRSLKNSGWKTSFILERAPFQGMCWLVFGGVWLSPSETGSELSQNDLLFLHEAPWTSKRLLQDGVLRFLWFAGGKFQKRLYTYTIYYSCILCIYIYTNTYIVYKYVSSHACIHIYIYISYVSLNIIAQWIVWLSCKKRQDLRTDGSSFKVKTVSVYPYCVIPLPFRE